MNWQIDIQDNSQKKLSGVTEETIRDLSHLASYTIGELADIDLYPNLLTLPHDSLEQNDDVADQHICTLDSSGTLATGNIMGFVGCGSTKLRIYSRFQQNSHDYFLHYMLERVFSIRLFDLPYQTDEDSIFDFRIYLFPHFLKRALRQGLYKEYRTRECNDANVKGRIDIPRQLRLNVPFAGNVAYTMREYTTDNPVMQLVRHTIAFISRHPIGANVLTMDDETAEAVEKICGATPSFNPADRKRIIRQNQHIPSHPYYDNYPPLQLLCLQILRHEELKYGRKKDEIYGILFDGAWLWEEYLASTLMSAGFQHPQNKLRTGRIYLFKDKTGYRYPDFLKNGFVADAKYKRHADKNLGSRGMRDDIHQLITYMYIQKAERGTLIVPTESIAPQWQHKQLCGYGGRASLYALPVSPNCTDYPSYCSAMQENERQMIRFMKSI